MFVTLGSLFGSMLISTLLMLQAMCAGLQGFLYLVSHPQPPETFPQQQQGTVMPLMTCISVAPIQSGGIVCLGDHEEHEIFSVTFGH